MTATRTKTSISVDTELWRTFGAKLQLEGVDKSTALEVMIRQFIGAAVTHVPHHGNEQAITPRDESERQIVAALLRFLHDQKPEASYAQFLKGHKATLRALLQPWLKGPAQLKEVTKPRKKADER